MNASQAQATAPPPSEFRRQPDRDDPVAAMKDLSLQETLRVMDVAREMRDNRVAAEEMFQREDLRTSLRNKLMKTASLSGEPVTEAEIDAAIAQYFDRLHVFEANPPAMSNAMAHLWIWRTRIIAATAAIGAAAGAFWYFF